MQEPCRQLPLSCYRPPGAKIAVHEGRQEATSMAGGLVRGDQEEMSSMFSRGSSFGIGERKTGKSSISYTNHQ